MLLYGVLFATATSAAEPAGSSEPGARRTFVGLVPFELGKGVLAVDAQRVESPKHSIRLGVRLDVDARDLNEGSATRSRLLIGIQPGFRYYLTGSALDGLWVGPHLDLSLQGVEARDGFLPNHWGWSVGVGTLVGYSMVVTRGLTVQAGVGLGVSYLSGHFVYQHLVVDPNSELTYYTRVWEFKEWSFTESSTLVVGWTF
jgi:hypothetical protein